MAIAPVEHARHLALAAHASGGIFAAIIARLGFDSNLIHVFPLKLAS
jgi:hypothetical protein